MEHPMNRHPYLIALVHLALAAGCNCSTKPAAPEARPTTAPAPRETWPTARDNDLGPKPPAGGESRMVGETPPNTQLLMSLSAKGDQIYTVAAGPDHKPVWSSATPDARLYDESGKQVGTHGKGPGWTLTEGGTVIAQLPPTKKISADPNAVPWLELAAKPGSGTGSLAGVTLIQRTSTTGGVPSPADLTPANVGMEFRVPYTAQYLFFRAK
jgi:hypothetical protein